MSTAKQRQGKAILPLTPERAALRAQHELVISQGLQAFVAVGEALLAMRDEKLYQPEYKTFEDYLKARWNISRAEGYRLMEAAQVVNSLSQGLRQMLENPNQARALAEVPPHLREEVLRRIMDADLAVTEQVVARTVSDLLDERRAQEKEGAGNDPEQDDPSPEEDQAGSCGTAEAPSSETLRKTARRHAKPTMYVSRGNEHVRLGLKDAKKATWTDVRSQKQQEIALQTAQMAEEIAHIWRSLVEETGQAKAA